METLVDVWEKLKIAVKTLSRRTHVSTLTAILHKIALIRVLSLTRVAIHMYIRGAPEPIF